MQLISEWFPELEQKYKALLMMMEQSLLIYGSLMKEETKLIGFIHIKYKISSYLEVSEDIRAQLYIFYMTERIEQHKKLVGSYYKYWDRLPTILIEL